jgi:hypothetical protein
MFSSLSLRMVSSRSKSVMRTGTWKVFSGKAWVAVMSVGAATASSSAQRPPSSARRGMCSATSAAGRRRKYGSP